MSSTPATSDGLKLFRPDIFDFARLFHSVEKADSPNWGFPEGTSILVSGPPGSGKSTFALAVARGILFAELRVLLANKEDQNKEYPKTFPLIYYVSTEVGVQRLTRIFKSTGWFEGVRLPGEPHQPEKKETGDILFGDEAKFEDKPMGSRFRCVSMPVDTARPVPTSEELVNALTFEIRQQHALSSKSKAIVIVDSLTALLRDCHDRGDERRLTHEFIHRLNGALGKDHLALTFFISEQSVDGEHWSSVPVEEYVVDFVFRLKLRDTGMGRRLRVLDIIKSHGARLRLGEHTWSIVTEEGLDDIITPAPLQSLIKGLASEAKPWRYDKDMEGQICPDFSKASIRDWRSLLDLLRTGDVSHHLGESTRKDLESLAPALAHESRDIILRALNEWFASREGDRFEERRKLEHRIRQGGRIFAGWGTVSVYPATGLPPIGRAVERGSDSNKPLLVATGVPGLDEMLNFDSAARDFWMKCELGTDATTAKQHAGLIPGTITVLVGHAGAGKTNICLQFLLAAEKRAGDRKTTDQKAGSEKKDGIPGLYINFEAPFDEIVTHFPDTNSQGELKRLQSIYRRRGNLDINALLAEVRFLVPLKKIDRIAIDGLSSLLATTTPAEYSRLIESLIGTIRRLSDEREITLMLTYEPDSDELSPIVPVPRLSAVADNLIHLRPVAINDEVRQTIHIAKARGLPHDRTVREVRVHPEQERPVRVVAGLEAFTGILSGKPERVNVALQLFHENWAEEQFNRYLKRRLTGVFNYNVDILGFSRNAIARMLDELSSPTPTTPASNVKVLSFDEWQIRDHTIDQGAKGPEGQLLLRLTPFEGVGDGAVATSSERNFWASDIRKARSKNGSQLLAIPHYLDFGMFCVNWEIAVACGLAGTSPSNAAQVAAHGGPVSNAQWRNFVNKLPMCWALPDKTNKLWFKPPDASKDDCIVDWMQRAVDVVEKELPDAHPYCGYVFDLATPETAVVTFLELAWAFGAEECVFDNAHSADQITDDHPAARALRFLMYLVWTGLMPKEACIDDSRRALFSRHFYSTFCDIVVPPPRPKTDRASGSEKEAASDVPLVIMPFMPTGQKSAAATRSIEDDNDTRWNRFKNILNEILYARNDPAHPVKGAVTPEALLSQCLALKSLRPTTSVSKKGGSNPPSADALPYIGAVDYRDIVRNIKRHQLRLRLMNAKPGALSTAFDECNEPPGSLGIPTGYCCTGAWMLGVHSHTHSAGLSCELISEMTSLENARERAKWGAGIPARKDFYDLYGHTPVTNAPYLKWNDLLLFCGARARHRDRAIPGSVRVRDFNQWVYDELRACLEFAALKKTPKDMIKRALASVTAIQRAIDKSVNSGKDASSLAGSGGRAKPQNRQPETPTDEKPSKKKNSLPRKEHRRRDRGRKARR